MFYYCCISGLAEMSAFFSKTLTVCLHMCLGRYVLTFESLKAKINHTSIRQRWVYCSRRNSLETISCYL